MSVQNRYSHDQLVNIFEGSNFSESMKDEQFISHPELYNVAKEIFAKHEQKPDQALINAYSVLTYDKVSSLPRFYQIFEKRYLQNMIAKYETELQKQLPKKLENDIETEIAEFEQVTIDDTNAAMHENEGDTSTRIVGINIFKSEGLDEQLEKTEPDIVNSITVLDIDTTNEKALDKLIEFLSKCKNIKIINLSFSSLSEAQAQKLATALEGKLTLMIRLNGVADSAGANHIINAINFSKLKILKLSNCHLDSSCEAALLKKIVKDKQLVLNLEKNNISEEFVENVKKINEINLVITTP